MRRRIAVLAAGFVAGTVVTCVVAVLLVVSGYEADAAPPAPADPLGWSLLAVGAAVMVASFVLIVLMLRRWTRGRTAR